MSELRAHAKLTTSLEVVGTRPDGYHLLEAEMVSIDLFDTLVIDANGDGIEVIDVGGTRAELLQGTNIISRALEVCGRHGFVKLTKRIPLGGGLGGGSADAAAILRWASNTNLEVAASLGSDVPFCVVGGRAKVRGVGEIIERLSDQDGTYTVIIPPFAISTPAVYRRYDELVAASTPTARGHERNHLTTAALSVEPRLEELRLALEAKTGMLPSLAGSGSTVFFDGSAEDLGLNPSGTIDLAGMTARIIEVHAVAAEIPA